MEKEMKREEEEGAGGADEFGPAANRSIPLIAQLARAGDANAM